MCSECVAECNAPTHPEVEGPSDADTLGRYFPIPDLNTFGSEVCPAGAALAFPCRAQTDIHTHRQTDKDLSTFVDRLLPLGNTVETAVEQGQSVSTDRGDDIRTCVHCVHGNKLG